jgi:hypothetical protein
MLHRKRDPAGGDGRGQGNRSRWHTNNPHPNNRAATRRQEPIKAELSSALCRAALSHVGHVRAPLLGEENDAYPTIARLDDRWRVIACRQSIQWILQRQRGGYWRGYWFCRTREALVRGARQHAGPINGDTLVILLRLPERFPEASP